MFFINSALAMAKTLIWHCQVVKINEEKQINGKINKYKIDVTTPMVWVGDATRWSGFSNTQFSYDKDNHTLSSSTSATTVGRGRCSSPRSSASETASSCARSCVPIWTCLTIRPTAAETQANPRARSARLRWAVRTEAAA